MGLPIGRQLPWELASSDACSQTNSESPVKTQSQEHLPSPIKSLRQLAEAEQSCTRCPLYREATQAVPGEGPNHAPFMLIGEQPGDKEDIAGKPFVGPAGRVLDQALQDAGIRRTETFVTNAVKHFKHEMRGKRRLHKRPDNYEIERCKIWLDVERSLVKPDTVVALGVTAARSLTGRTLTIGKVRGKPITMADGTRLIVTIHPSALLRVEDEDERHAAYQNFVADLKAAMAAHSGEAPRKKAS
jgi:uracil-DNA glycosylase